jgi:O-antigen/teichoic acid export membrane protein
MGPHEFGEYAVGVSLATLFANLFAFGQPQGALRIIPEHRARGEEGLAHGAYRAGMTVSLAAGLLGGILFAVGAFAGSHLGFQIDLPPMIATATLIPAIAASLYWSSAGRVVGRIMLAMLPADVIWRVLVMGVAALLWLRGATLTGPGVLYWSAGLLAGLILAQALLIGRAIPGAIRDAKPRYDFRGWRYIWSTMWVAATLTTVLNQIDIALVAGLMSSEDAGLYVAALRTANLLSLALVGVNTVIAPLCSRYYYSGDMNAVQALFRTAAPGLLAAAVGGVLFLALFGHVILGTFGPHFTAMYWPLLIVTVGMAVNVLCGPVGMMMMMTGRQVVFVTILAISAVVSISVQAIGIVAFGTMGAAIGNCIAQIFWNVTLWLYIRHTTGIDASAFSILFKSGKNAGKTLEQPIASAPED